MSVTSLGGLKLADGDEMGPAETNPFGGVEEFQCGLFDCAEFGAVILVEFWVGFHGFLVKFVERLNIVNSFLLQSNSETVGEVRDGVIGGR